MMARKRGRIITIGSVAAFKGRTHARRIATVDEVARVVEFLAGSMSAFVSGQVIRVDGSGQN